MTTELRSLRSRFGSMLVLLLWANVPIMGFAAWMAGRSIPGAIGAGMVVAAVYHLTYRRHGQLPVTRYMSAVCMMALPAALVFILRGHTWQMDMHMYFFAMLALLIGWFDRRTIFFAALVVALHHLIFLWLLPFAVFPAEASLERVLVHAAIVIFQAVILMIVADTVTDRFRASESLSEALRASNASLEERSAEAEAASATKSMFLANMSHEIRTPLNAVLGFCHLLQRTEMTSRQEDYVSKISSSGTALLRLINDILDYSKNEAGRLELEIRPFSLQSAMEYQLQMVLGDARAKGVDLILEQDDRIPANLAGDELRFGQVVLNLVSNAVKFTEQGSVTVRTRLVAETASVVTVGVDVIDTGIGMSPEQQERLFTSFTQADSTMTRRFGGTGLGLAIARQIVQMMGGDITVRSVQWSGTTFSLQVRFQRYEGEVAVEAALHPALRRLRVLAVDDNPASRQIIREVFADWSVHVDTASAADEAISRLEQASEVGRSYDLLLLDWRMPGKDGLEAARAIRSNPLILQKPRMVVLTAYGSDEFTAEVEGSGISAYLTKPLEPRALRQTLEELYLPKGDAPAVEEARAPKPAAQAAGREVPQVAAEVQGLRVLLVEDNEINREIATELLTDAGLLVDVAENGLLACEQIEREGDSYSAVLMDIQMPVMDGMEATRRIRSGWTAEQLPVIAMTAHAYADERQRCLDIGMNDHIAKPVDPKVLIETLGRYLRPRGGTAGLSAGADTAAPVAPATLPEHLPPFNIGRALERVNGKQALLRRLILSFAETQARAGDDIRALIARGETADARRLSHTLKGLAGSLELPDLQVAAAAVERALMAEETAALHALLEEMERCLVPAIAAARSLDAGAPQVPQDAPVEYRPQIAAAELQSLVEKMEDQIRRRNLGARGTFTALAAALGLSEATGQQHPVKKALDRLDYETATRELSAMKLGELTSQGAADRE